MGFLFTCFFHKTTGLANIKKPMKTSAADIKTQSQSNRKVFLMYFDKCHTIDLSPKIMAQGNTYVNIVNIHSKRNCLYVVTYQ